MSSLLNAESLNTSSNFSLTSIFMKTTLRSCVCIASRTLFRAKQCLCRGLDATRWSAVTNTAAQHWVSNAYSSAPSNDLNKECSSSLHSASGLRLLRLGLRMGRNPSIYLSWFIYIYIYIALVGLPVGDSGVHKLFRMCVKGAKGLLEPLDELVQHPLWACALEVIHMCGDEAQSSVVKPHLQLRIH